MNHFGGHVIESARTQFGALAFACQYGFPEIMVCDSLAVCQCFRTWIAFEVRISRLVTCVFGSTRRKQISGELSPRLGIILSHLRSDKFLKIGASLVADFRLGKPPFYPFNYDDVSEIGYQESKARYYGPNTKNPDIRRFASGPRVCATTGRPKVGDYLSPAQNFLQWTPCTLPETDLASDHTSIRIRLLRELHARRRNG